MLKSLTDSNSMTMRTACSSSLVALNAACEAISNGHCDAAVVAGSSLIFSLTNSMCLTQDGLMSPNGACKSFDASADGYARGEAINAIFIKKKDDAVRNNDPIRAIVRGTATNFDGRTASMSTPNPITQEQLMRHTYKMAGIDNVSETGFIECHATGTAVGDPLEAEAVARVFGKEGITMGAVSHPFSLPFPRIAGLYKYYEQLKSNIGHSEGASAPSGVIKAVLSLEHRQIPPNLNFSKPHPKSMVPILSFEEENRTYVETNTSDIVPVAEARLSFPTELREWPKDRLERASVNAFGIGGVNAHVRRQMTTDPCFWYSCTDGSRQSSSLTPCRFHPPKRRPLHPWITPSFLSSLDTAKLLYRREAFSFRSMLKLTLER